MRPQLANSPSFSSLASLGATLYTSKRILLNKDALVIFTCGARSSNTPSARDNFLDYANRYFEHGTFFRAEDTFPVLLGSRSDDLLTIEQRLAEYSDCVLIINESAGTIAELGAFATSVEVVKKLLVVNPKEYMGRDSFINRGPIAKADKKSRFKKTIHVDLRSVSIHFDTILSRIEKYALRKRRLGIDFSKPQAWKKAEGKLRLLFLQDIINLFSPLTSGELLTVMKRLFPTEYVKFDIELGLLVATNKIRRHEDTVFIAARSCADHNYAIDSRAWLGLRKKIIDLYRSRDNSRLVHLFARSAEPS